MGKKCTLCGIETSGLAANPMVWPIKIPTPTTAPGVVQTHCTECVINRVYRRMDDHCGCGYDNPDDVCIYHTKIVRARIIADAPRAWGIKTPDGRILQSVSTFFTGDEAMADAAKMFRKSAAALEGEGYSLTQVAIVELKEGE